jgi:hypothetical protein
MTDNRVKDPSALWLWVDDVGQFNLIIEKCLRDAALVGKNGEVRNGSTSYFVEGGGICMRYNTRNGPKTEPLANFDARITREIREDDGNERRVWYEIKVTLNNGSTRTITVLSDKYPRMDWIAGGGSSACIAAGSSRKDHLRVAIQLRSSPQIVERYTHTGWRNRNGEYSYIHCGGAIGANGSVPGIETAFDGRLALYQFPDPPTDDMMTKAVRATLKLLKLAHRRIMAPILAGAFRAVLIEAMPCTMTIHKVGPSGAFKTEVCAIAQGFYGRGFSSQEMPGSWGSTANSLEKAMFFAKDVLFTIDDLVPAGSIRDVDHAHAKAEQCLRSVGNHTGRGRLTADCRERTTYFPRCMVVSNGEDVPRGTSLSSRIFFVEIAKNSIDIEKLTDAQNQRSQGVFASAMSGYIKWLASRMPQLKKTLPGRFHQVRAEIKVGVHRRIPSNAADLLIGLETFVAFAREVVGSSDEELLAFEKDGSEGILEMAALQDKWLRAQDPVERFFGLISAALASGLAHIDGRDGESPSDHQTALGWRQNNFNDESRWQPQGRCIGWIFDEALYLEPEATHRVARQHAMDGGGASLQGSSHTLFRSLRDRGYLAHWDKKREVCTVRKTLAGSNRSVLHLSEKAMEALGLTFLSGLSGFREEAVE